MRMFNKWHKYPTEHGYLLVARASDGSRQAIAEFPQYLKCEHAFNYLQTYIESVSDIETAKCQQVSLCLGLAWIGRHGVYTTSGSIKRSLFGGLLLPLEGVSKWGACAVSPLSAGDKWFQYSQYVAHVLLIGAELTVFGILVRLIFNYLSI